MEIVSPSSIKKDKVQLRRAYYLAGIEEYWIVDVLGKEIEFQLLTRGENEYVAAKPRDGWLGSPTFDREFRLVRGRDSDDSWQYTLHVHTDAPH